MKKINAILNIALPIIAISMVMLLWAVSAKTIGNSHILPTVKETLSSLIVFLKSKEFYRALLSTILRSVIAFFTSFFIAGAFAVLSQKFFVARRIIEPLISVIRTLPTLAVVLLLVLWTDSNVAPVIVTALVVFPTEYVEIKNALLSIDIKQIEMCKTYNVPFKDVLFKVEVPQIAPYLLRAIGAGLSLNLKLMVAAEVIGQTAYSMGYLLQSNYVFYEMSNMLAVVVAIIIVGVTVEAIFGLISKKAGKWQ